MKRIAGFFFTVLVFVAACTSECHAVVPVLIGPIQALFVILPQILLALFGVIISLLKPAMMKKMVKLLWRQKVVVLIFIGVITGIVYLFNNVFAGSKAVLPSEVTESNWTMFRGGLERRGATADVEEPVFGGVNWAFKNEVKTFYSSPCVVGNRVYVNSADKGFFKDAGSIYCLDAKTGGIVWKSTPKGFRATFSSPSVSEKYLVTGEGLHFTRDARVVCLDVEKGKLLWEFRTKSHVESSPCIYKGKVYVGAGDDGYYCFDLATGKILWHLEGEKYPDAEAPPAVYNGKVYLGLGNKGNAVVCVDAETGKELWRTKAPFPVFTPPTIANNKVFVGMGIGNFIQGDDEVVAIELQKLKVEGKTAAEITEAKKTIKPGGEVWCLNAETGAPIWSFKADRSVLGAIVAGKDRLYFASRDGFVYCISYEGKEIGRWNAHAAILSSPSLTANYIYCVTETGKLYALGNEDLKLVWETTIGTVGPFISSPAIAKGHVYVGSQQDGLLCLGVPGNEKKEPVWATALGGASKLGSVDMSPIPDQGTFGWRYPFNEDEQSAIGITAPGAVLGDKIYIPIAEGAKKGLVCLKKDPKNPDSPIESFYFKTTGGVSLSPACYRNNVYFVEGKKGEANRYLYSVDANTGTEKWKVKVAPEVSGKFILQDDYIFIENQDGILIRLDSSGKTLWQKNTGALLETAVFKEDILVAATKTLSKILALDLETGGTLWEKALDAPAKTGPVVLGARIYIGAGNGILSCDLIDGKNTWKSSTGKVETLFAMSKDYITYVNSGSELIVLDIADGNLKARIPQALNTVPPLFSRDDILYVSKGDIMYYNISTKEGHKWMKAAWMGKISAPMIMSDSNVYFATDKRGFICAKKKKG